MNRPRDAFDAATKAVDLCKGDEASCIDALGRRAAAHAALGKAQAALADINAALELIEGLRNRLVPTDFFKQDFNQRAGVHLQPGDRAAGAAEAGTPGTRDRRARTGARVSRSARQPRRAAEGSRSPAIASLQRKTSPQPSRIELSASNQPPVSALTLRGGNSVHESTTRSSDRDIELRSFVTASPSAADDLVATAARLRSTLVVYWVGEDELFIWVVTPDGAVQARRVAVLPARLVELIRETSPFAEKHAASSGPARS